MSQEELAAETRRFADSHEKKNMGAVPVFMSSNRVWANSKFGFDPKDFEIGNKYFETKVEPVEFPQPACQIINAAVEKQTNGLIKNFLNEASLPEITQFVLTNSAYFKAKWLSKFKQSSTRKSSFTSFDQRKSIIDMMFQNGKFKYAENGDSQILSMDYENSDFSLAVILPFENTNTAFDKMISNIGAIFGSVKQMNSRDVDVYMPKFQLEWGTESVRQCLQSMGMIDAFSGKAEFPSKSSLGDVLQKAVFICDEEGTEAAAASAAIMYGAIPHFGASKKVTFKADHPFAFFLYDRKDNSILFEGSVAHL